MEPLPRTFTRRRAGKSALALPLLLVLSLAAAQARPASARSGTPTVKITSQPPASTSSTTAAISFTTSNARLVECSLDGGNFFGCVSPQNYAGLSVGKHKVVVRATRDRRSATASAAWEVVASPAPPPSPSSWPSRPRSRTVRPSPGRPPGRRRRARRSARFSSTWTERSVGRRATRPTSSTATATSSTRRSSPTAATCFASWRPQVTAPRPATSGTVQVANSTAPPPTPSPPPALAPSAGRVQFMEKTSPSTDQYTNNPTPDQTAVVPRPLAARDRRRGLLGFEELVVPAGVGLPGRVRDLQPSTLANQHPEWILKDAAGNKLYIPWGCSGRHVPAVRGRHRQPGLAAVLHRPLQGCHRQGLQGHLRRRRGHGHQRRQRRRTAESRRSTRARARR